MNRKFPPSRKPRLFLALLFGISFLLVAGTFFPRVAWMQSGDKDKPKKAETGGRNPKRAVSGRAGKPGAAKPAQPQFDPYAAELQADGSMIGKPATGEKGVTETVNDLMVREAKIAPYRSSAPRKSIEREVERENLPSAPGAPAVSSWPPSEKTDDTTARGTKRGVTGVVTPNAPQTVSTPNFTGATLSDTGAFPPDTMGAVGPTQFIVAVNGRIRSFNKTTGVADSALNLDTDVFFNSVMTPPTASNFTSDPRIRYDRLSGRWFIIIIDVPGGAGSLANRVLIAVSDSSTISSTSNFTFFQYQISTTLFADYPTLGIDNNALYIGANMFTLAGSFDSTAGTVIRKSSILGAGPIVFTNFAGLAVGAGAGPFTPQGVDNYDPAATEGYFIGVDNAVFSQLDIRRVSNPGATPTLSANLTITVPTTNFPNPVTHLGNAGGNNGRLDSLDDRLFAAHFRNGRLWTAHNIRVNASGVASTTAGVARNAVRWYELQNLDTTPIVRQSGTIFDNAATLAAAQQYWIPSVMVSGQGHAAFGFSAAGTNFRADGATVGRLSTDTLGQTQGTPVRYTSSSTAYNPPSDAGGGSGRRWGDYSYTSLDPLDDMTMWTVQEFCDATNTYGVRVVRLLAPPPATPTSASPTSVTAGTTTNVTITGTSTSGSGFYDPPATLSGRIPISASVSGTGVTVNSVTFTSPTSVTLNVTVSSGATTGARDVTVTNPDGQSNTGTGILTVAPPACSTPVVINSSLSFSSSGSLVAPTCGAAGYTNDYVLNATITNISSQTLCSVSTQVVALNEAGGPTPAVPFRLISADGATCTSGGLVGSVQSIPGTLGPGQSTNVTFRIAIPEPRRFVFQITFSGGTDGSVPMSLKAAANVQKPFEVQIDGAAPVREQPVKPTAKPKAKRND